MENERNKVLPFASHFFDRDGIRMHYLDEGNGEPVVMLHGNPTWCFYYRNLVTALREQYRCIVPDHVGMGLSDKPDDTRYQYTLASRVEDLERLLDSLKLPQKINLILHDWGGMIGMVYAVRHPERIARIVAMNTSAFHLPASKSFPWALRLARSWPGAFLIRGFNAFCRVAARVCCVRKPLSRELRNAYCFPYNSWANRIATLRFVQDIPLKPGDPAYALVDEVEAHLDYFRHTPILLCWGMRDFVFDHHFLDKWTEAFPHAEVHRFSDCGHYILEDADNEVIAAVRQFLSSQVRESKQ